MGDTGEARGLFDNESQLVCEEELLVANGDCRLVVAGARFWVADFTEICATVFPVRSLVTPVSPGCGQTWVAWGTLA